MRFVRPSIILRTTIIKYTLHISVTCRLLHLGGLKLEIQGQYMSWVFLCNKMQNSEVYDSKYLIVLTHGTMSHLVQLRIRSAPPISFWDRGECFSLGGLWKKWKKKISQITHTPAHPASAGQSTSQDKPNISGGGEIDAPSCKVPWQRVWVHKWESSQPLVTYTMSPEKHLIIFRHLKSYLKIKTSCFS